MKQTASNQGIFADHIKTTAPLFDEVLSTKPFSIKLSFFINGDELLFHVQLPFPTPAIKRKINGKNQRQESRQS